MGRIYVAIYNIIDRKRVYHVLMCIIWFEQSDNFRQMWFKITLSYHTC